MDKPTYYKILVNGKSAHGGAMEWSLPTQNADGTWAPGKWHRVDGEIRICQRGIHATTKPFEWYKTGCTCYEIELGEILGAQGKKVVTNRARLLREIPHPQWWLDTMAFVETIKDIPYCKPDGKPLPEWKLFTGQTLAAAWDAARAAAGAATGDAAWAAALYARCLIVADKLDPKHLAHAQARMDVWRKGYCLLCDVNGVLYVYAQEASK